MTASHKRDLIGYGNAMPSVEWPGGARIAISLVVNFEEGAERTPLYGDAAAESTGEGFMVPAGVRDPRNETFFEYGMRVGFWRLIDILDRQDVPATFFICAKALETNPEAARTITARGHEPAAHGYRWLPIYTLGREEERRQLHLAVQRIRELTGERPLGWYSRGASMHTRSLVMEEGGFLYDCDSYADDLPFFVEHESRPWLVVPYSLETNDIKFYRSPGYSTPNDFFNHLTAAFDCLYREGARAPKMMSVGLHLRYAGRPARAAALERFIAYARAHDGVWFARRADIARWWLDNHHRFTR